jgi:uncharacterized protein with von Willebrand factor type A (vWA) domain
MTNQEPEQTHTEIEMSEQDNPTPELVISPFAEKFGEPHSVYIQQYLNGEIDAVELISELEFDNFDGDVFEIL